MFRKKRRVMILIGSVKKSAQGMRRLVLGLVVASEST
jgi:hypothetical protein